MEIPAMPSKLPAEIIFHILSYLPDGYKFKTMLALTATSKYLRAFSLPCVYSTIHLSAPDPRLDGHDIQRQHFRRLNQLLRSLVNNPMLAGYIRTIELVRWNVDAAWAGITEAMHTTDGTIFTEVEMQQLKSVVTSLEHSIGYPTGGRNAVVAGDCNMDTLVPLSATRGVSASNWWMEQLQSGSLDASFAVLLFIVNQQQEGMQRGLQELRLKLDHTSDRQQPECLWWVLWYLVGHPRDPENKQLNLPDSGTGVTQCSSSMSPKAFPYLQRVEIRATKWRHIPLDTYDCNLTQIAAPFLLHRSVSDLRLTLLDKSPFSWAEAGMLSSPPMTQLRNLYLKIAHLESLHPILLCTPNLKTLFFTHLRNYEFQTQRVLQISIPASALAPVKRSLTTLTLGIFLFGACDLYAWRDQCGPRGNPRELRLWEFPQLRTITIGLALLLGSDHYCGMSLAEALPVQLEVCRLVYYSCALEAFCDGDYSIADLVISYMYERGKGKGGKLHKLVFVEEIGIAVYSSKVPAEKWRDCPPRGQIPMLEAAALAASVVIEYAFSYEIMRWYHDYNLDGFEPTPYTPQDPRSWYYDANIETTCLSLNGLDKGDIMDIGAPGRTIYPEIPRHSIDPVPTTEKILVDGVRVPVCGGFRHDLHFLER